MANLVSFWSFVGDRMAYLGLIKFKLGLYIKVNVNIGQNKFEVYISNHWPKWPLVGTNRPDATFGQED